MFLATREPADDRVLGKIRREHSRRIVKIETTREEVLSVDYLSRQFKDGYVEPEGMDCVEDEISQGWGLPSTHITGANL
jgi:hypothetical protein